LLNREKKIDLSYDIFLECPFSKSLTNKKLFSCSLVSQDSFIENHFFHIHPEEENGVENEN
jgi:hypothetical protein